MVRKNETASEANLEKPKKGGKYVLRFLILIVILGFAGAAGYYYKQYENIKNNPQAVSQEETQQIISELGKLMELPEGTPSLATVQDKEKLKDQSFFRRAENGDKVLIYADAKQAILYRPSAKKIIEVAPLILNNEANAQTNSEGNNGQNSQDDSNEDKE